MIFVVDTKIVFSGLLKNSKTRELLITAPFDFIAPNHIFTEIRKYEKLIIEKSSLTKKEFEILFSLLTENIKIFGKEFFKDKLEESKKLMNIDEVGDFPFLALALSTYNNGIWTYDKHFDR